MKNNSITDRSKLGRIIAVLIIGLFLYAIIPQFSVFKGSLPNVRHADMNYFLVAVIAGLSTYMFAALIYMTLAFRTLRFGPTILVQIASMFVNRLLPAGIGALGTSYLYLRYKKHTSVQAAAVITLNNTLGILGHMILLVSALVLFPKTLHFGWPAHAGRWFIFAALFFAGLCLGLYVFKRVAIKRGLSLYVTQLKTYLRRPGSVGLGIFFSMLLTLGNVLCVWLCLRSVGASLSIPSVLIAYSAGVWLSTSIPTPGGLGGLEAGLAAGLVAYHVPSDHAVAAVILFRLITYWLGLAIGAPAFFACERLRLLTAK